MEAYLVEYIKDTIDMFSKRLPDIYDNNKGYVCIYWKVNEEQDSLWEMFSSRQSMEKYFDDIKYFFETDYPEYELGIKIDVCPIIYDDDNLYGRVVLYYYVKNIHHNANTFFIA